ncbi:MAG: Nramp family divalent metal transporter [Acidobacteriota bacterium]|nr:Nramp family divalent metal transporter [Acidobacteriota bacterium]
MGKRKMKAESQKANNQKANNTEQANDAGKIPEPPQGWQRFVWLGPGFLWMVSAAGSGEMLFTPRVAAQYGYALLWALLAAVILKWFINREVGRFAVCTGATVLEGFRRLPGPKNWAVWVIVVPQLVVAAASLAGLAAAAATALILVLPGDVRLWMIISICASTALVLYGKYKGLEWTARILAVVLAVASLAAAISVFPSVNELLSGLIPRVPAGVDYGEILPWLGYMLSGAAGMMWYSYWVTAKGYGAAGRNKKAKKDEKTESENAEDDNSNSEFLDPKKLDEAERKKLGGWLTQMSLDTTVAVIGALIITIAFLILGAELLRPRGLVPEENRVAETLGVLLGGVFGAVGYWFMIFAVFIGFWDTVLSDQDGHGRLQANGTRILSEGFGLKGKWTNEKFLKKAFVVVLVTLIPIALYLIFGEPITLLKIAGAIEAAHIPVVTGLMLYLNHRTLPADLRPSWFAFAVTALAGLFFAAFAVIYLVSLIAPDAV